MKVIIKTMGTLIAKDGSDLPSIHLEVGSEFPETPAQAVETYKRLSLELRKFQLDELLVK